MIKMDSSFEEYEADLSVKISHIFSNIIAFLIEVFIIDIKHNLRSKMEFRRNLRWLLIVLMSLFLFAGCGDLEPELQDTQTEQLMPQFLLWM